MDPQAAIGLVHRPLARWAAARGAVLAIRDGSSALTFEQLWRAVQQRAAELTSQRAPATVFVDDRLPVIGRIVDFLGIIASGRCAAVADADWPAQVRMQVFASVSVQAADLSPPGPSTPFYTGFTSGSTGLPKGFRRSHRSWAESFSTCMATFGMDADSPIVAPGAFSHSLFLFGMLLGLWSGAGVVVQTRFSAARLLRLLPSAGPVCLVAVPSQLALLLAMARHRGLPPVTAVRQVLISGARWMRDRTPELQALFPRARIIEFYGASETSFVAWMDADAAAPPEVVGRPFANVKIEIRGQDPGDAHGLIFVRSPMLFMDYVGVGADGTQALWDGDWLSVRDMGRLDAEGRLCLAGRQNRMIVTCGKNLFPEEVEEVLTAFPGLAAASVHGTTDDARGVSVAAIIRHAPDAAAKPTAKQLSDWCRQRLQAYKVPRRFHLCDDWPLTAGGKTDHHKLGLSLLRETHAIGRLPCLQALR